MALQDQVPPPPQHHTLKSIVVTETLPTSRTPLNINYNFQSLDDLPKSSIEFILQPEYSQVQCDKDRRDLFKKCLAKASKIAQYFLSISRT